MALVNGMVLAEFFCKQNVSQYHDHRLTPIAISRQSAAAVATHYYSSIIQNMLTNYIFIVPRSENHAGSSSPAS